MHKRAKHNPGFTMIELLVSMAILTTVISGVVLLYIGAVNTTRQGYRAIDNFEIGRSLLAAIERDLERSFAARDYGKFYQFHGGPEAFMYVGVLSDGSLGRVTYAINRLDAENDFTMAETQALRSVIERAMEQLSGPDGAFPAVAEDFTRKLVQLLALDDNIVSGNLSNADIIRLLPLALDNALVIAINNLGSPKRWQLGPLVVEDPPGSGNIINFNDATVALDVNVQTAYMLRYEEPGVNNISSFVLPPDPDNPLVSLRFPNIDPTDVYGVRNNPDFGYLASACTDVDQGTDAIAATGQMLLDCYAWGSIVLPVGADPLEIDLRRLITGESGFAVGVNGANRPASYITGRTVDAIVEAAKRELWLDLFTGAGYAPQILANSSGVQLARNYFDAWNLDNAAGTPESRANNKDPYDYAIGERIVVAGRVVTYQDVFDTATWGPNFASQFFDFDILGIEAFFTYADVDPDFRETYNSLDDIPGYENFADPNFIFDPDEIPNSGDEFAPLPEDRFVAFDEIMGNEMTGIPTVKSEGSPIAPRIPAQISPRFWIMSEGATVNSPPFKRFFDQVIEVPSSVRRNLPKQFVPNAG